MLAQSHQCNTDPSVMWNGSRCRSIHMPMRVPPFSTLGKGAHSPPKHIGTKWCTTFSPRHLECSRLFRMGTRWGCVVMQLIPKCRSHRNAVQLIGGCQALSNHTALREGECGVVSHLRSLPSLIYHFQNLQQWSCLGNKSFCAPHKFRGSGFGFREKRGIEMLIVPQNAFPHYCFRLEWLPIP